LSRLHGPQRTGFAIGVFLFGFAVLCVFVWIGNDMWGPALAGGVLTIVIGTLLVRLPRLAYVLHPTGIAARDGIGLRTTPLMRFDDVVMIHWFRGSSRMPEEGCVFWAPSGGYEHSRSGRIASRTSTSPVVAARKSELEAEFGELVPMVVYTSQLGPSGRATFMDALDRAGFGPLPRGQIPNQMVWTRH
jgi:hypothetical protein